MDQVRAELPPGADGDRPRELVLRDGLVGQCVHAHGNLRRIERVEIKAFNGLSKPNLANLEVVETVEEEAKVLKLVEPDADLLLLQSVNEPGQDGFVLLSVQKGVPVT